VIEEKVDGEYQTSMGIGFMEWSLHDLHLLELEYPRLIQICVYSSSYMLVEEVHVIEKASHIRPRQFLIRSIHHLHPVLHRKVSRLIVVQEAPGQGQHYAKCS